ncbi:hypothetical protein ACFVQ4_34100 [Streptomyces laurentii]|uniref:hypothetical protein n=1 Tax=Streptomyces laurentii TaxID=39478 RepID=UPI0036A757B8
MASKFRTKDGSEVRVGDKVGAKVRLESDNNPWLVTRHPHDKIHLVLQEIGGTEERVHFELQTVPRASYSSICRAKPSAAPSVSHPDIARTPAGEPWGTLSATGRQRPRRADADAAWARIRSVAGTAPLAPPASGELVSADDRHARDRP